MRNKKNDCPKCRTFEMEYSNVEVCSECGLGRTINVISTSDTQDYRQLTREEKAKREIYFERYIHRDLEKVEYRGRSLDIGCADGLFPELLKSNGWDAYGLEPFTELDDMHSNIYRTTVEDFEINEKFNLVTMIHSLEHVEHPDHVLNKIRKLINEEGYLLISVPHFEGIWSKLKGNNWNWLNLDEHYFHFTKQSLHNVLKLNGFNILYYRTSSLEAPSIVNEVFDKLGLFDGSYPFKKWISAATYKFGQILRKPLNSLIDRFNLGAELIILAKPDISEKE